LIGAPPRKHRQLYFIFFRADFPAGPAGAARAKTYPLAARFGAATPNWSAFPEGPESTPGPPAKLQVLALQQSCGSRYNRNTLRQRSRLASSTIRFDLGTYEPVVPTNMGRGDHNRAFAQHVAQR
jgi:hypothetical protein